MKKINLALVPLALLSLLSGCNSAPKEWYKYEDWWNYCSNGDEKFQAKEEDVGTEVDLLVNNQIHKVRLLDVDHDDLADGTGKAHCTFEFVNLLSDEKGRSLATVWGWKNGGETTTRDFINSDLRKALDGLGNGEIWWFKRGKVQSEQTLGTEYKDKTVFSMLPQNLQSVLKNVKKPIALKKDDSYVVDNDSYATKIFSLSLREMFTNVPNPMYEEGITYQYYINQGNGHKSVIHKQVKENEISSIAPTIADGEGRYRASNRAGFCPTSTHGGHFWTRSPTKNGALDKVAFHLTDDGTISNDNCYAFLQGIAPAFCI